MPHKEYVWYKPGGSECPVYDGCQAHMTSCGAEGSCSYYAREGDGGGDNGGSRSVGDGGGGNSGNGGNGDNGDGSSPSRDHSRKTVRGGGGGGRRRGNNPPVWVVDGSVGHIPKELGLDNALMGQRCLDKCITSGSSNRSDLPDGWCVTAGPGRAVASEYVHRGRCADGCGEWGRAQIDTPCCMRHRYGVLRLIGYACYRERSRLRCTVGGYLPSKKKKKEKKEDEEDGRGGVPPEVRGVEGDGASDNVEESAFDPAEVDLATALKDRGSAIVVRVSWKNGARGGGSGGKNGGKGEKEEDEEEEKGGEKKKKEGKRTEKDTTKTGQEKTAGKAGADDAPPDALSDAAALTALRHAILAVAKGPVRGAGVARGSMPMTFEVVSRSVALPGEDSPTLYLDDDRGDVDEVHGEAGFRVQYHKDSLDGVEVRMAAREVRGGEHSGVHTAVPGVSVDAALERAAPVWQALKILNRTRGETREATERDWEWDVDKWVW